MVELYILKGGPQDEYVGKMREEAAKEIIYERAEMYNYGMFRHWEIDGAKYYDVGPMTYKVIKIEK